MSITPIKSLLLLPVLTLSLSAMAQDSGSTAAGNIKEKLAAVNAEIAATSKENADLQARLTELQNQIDELKQSSKEKEDEINSLKEKDSGPDTGN